MAKTQIFGPNLVSVVSDAEIAPFVSWPDGEERLRRYIEKRVRALYAAFFGLPNGGGH